MTRAVAGLAGLASALLLCACGSSAGTSSSGAHAASTTASAPLTKAQALALAQAVNLRPSDLPGFKASGGDAGESETSEDRELSRCIGRAAKVRGLAEASSKNFERESSAGLESVQSSATVESTRAAVAEQIVAARSAHARACLAGFLGAALTRAAHGAASFSAVSVAESAPAARGTAGTFGWGITSTVSVRGVHFPVRFDILGFGYRRAVVTLFDFGFPQAFPQAQQQSLFSTLISRAQSFSS